MPGADADLVIVDFERSFRISAETLHGGVDWSPYNGKSVFGVVESTLLRGNFLVKNGELIAPRGIGQYLYRKTRPKGENYETKT